jgi:hypothetical protein
VSDQQQQESDVLSGEAPATEPRARQRRRAREQGQQQEAPAAAPEPAAQQPGARQLARLQRQKELTQRIQGASSWLEVRALLDAQGSGVNHIHAAAMLTRLADLQQQQQQQRAGDWPHLVLSRPRLFQDGQQQRGDAAAAEVGGGGAEPPGVRGGPGAQPAAAAAARPGGSRLDGLAAKEEHAEFQAFVRLLVRGGGNGGDGGEGGQASPR